MDLKTRLCLRSHCRQSHFPIAMSVWLAIMIHVFFLTTWKPLSRVTVPELPSWVNIKLVANFSEEKQPEKNRSPALQKENKVKQ